MLKISNLINVGYFDDLYSTVWLYVGVADRRVDAVVGRVGVGQRVFRLLRMPVGDYHMLVLQLL